VRRRLARLVPESAGDHPHVQGRDAGRATCCSRRSRPSSSWASCRSTRRCGSRPTRCAQGIRPLAWSGRLGRAPVSRDLKIKVERLLELLPEVEARESYLSPSRAISSVAALVAKHLEAAEAQARPADALQAELAGLDRLSRVPFHGAVASAHEAERPELEYIGRRGARFRPRWSNLTRVAGSGAARGAVARRGPRLARGSACWTDREGACPESSRKAARQPDPEVALPDYLAGLPLSGKLDAARARHDKLAAELAGHRRRGPCPRRGVARHVHQLLGWLRHRLTLLRTSARGLRDGTGASCCSDGSGGGVWTPLRRASSSGTATPWWSRKRRSCNRSSRRARHAAQIRRTSGRSSCSCRLLPTPRYTSIDPTPFIGIFFPLFFGMILADVGYGLLLAAGAAASSCSREQRARCARQGRSCWCRRSTPSCSASCMASSSEPRRALVRSSRRGSIGARHPADVVFSRWRWVPCTSWLGLALGLASSLRGTRRREADRAAAHHAGDAVHRRVRARTSPGGELMRKPLPWPCW